MKHVYDKSERAYARISQNELYRQTKGRESHQLVTFPTLFALNQQEEACVDLNQRTINKSALRFVVDLVSVVL